MAIIDFTVPTDDELLESIDLTKLKPAALGSYIKKTSSDNADTSMNVNEDASDVPPPVIIMRRTTIRYHDANRGTALYYADILKRYISIPFGPDTGITD